MRIFSLLAISLALLTGVAQARTVHVKTSLKALDVPLSQMDDRFGNMVAEIPCTVPFTFVNGTVAQAGQVNSNFQALSTCLNTIFASDIQPTSLAQATFGGNLQYTFPAGIAVAGGQNNPYTDTNGPIWIQQNGSNSGSFAIVLNWSNCGSAGSVLLEANATQKSFFDCQGNFLDGATQVTSGQIIAGNGNFTTPTGSDLQLCPGGCGSGPVVNIAHSNGAATFPSTLQASSNSAALGQVPPCYTAGGNSCTGTFHIVTGHVTLTLSGTCAAGTVCTFTGAGTITFSGAAAFADDNYSCSAANSEAFAGLVSQMFNQNAGQAQIILINPLSSGIAGSPAPLVGWECMGS